MLGLNWARAVLMISISMAGSAFAKAQPAVDRAKIFVLRGNARPTLVLPAKEAKTQRGAFMRMPDLGGVGGGRSSEDQKTVDKRKGSDHREVALRAPEPALGTAKKPLQFSSAMISGTLHMPRVKFARVGVPMENRDEMPSLDFTQKSLNESGF
jgi:hypothetical protein